MLVSEFTVDRKQWILDQTQQLAPSQIRPVITTFYAATLQADGGNPFFRKSSNYFAQNTTNSDGTYTNDPLLVDELGHKALQTNLGVSYSQIAGSPIMPFLFVIDVKGDAVYKFRETHGFLAPSMQGL